MYLSQLFEGETFRAVADANAREMHQFVRSLLRKLLLAVIMRLSRASGHPQYNTQLCLWEKHTKYRYPLYSSYACDLERLAAHRDVYLKDVIVPSLNQVHLRPFLIARK